MNEKMDYIFAGDREIAVRVLGHLISQGALPSALLVSDAKKASHAEELIHLCKHLDNSRILAGDDFRKNKGIELMRNIKPDYIFGVHFPYLVPEEVLKIPRKGVLNLHPAYLPYNRGWNTPSWAIWEGTPCGATLHFMDEGLDTGDIVHQKRLDVQPEETADSLYKRILQLEFEVFKEAWPSLKAGNYSRKKQPNDEGATRKKDELNSIQEVKLEETMPAGVLIKLLRSLTTNKLTEAAYFKKGNERYRMQINITKEVE